MGTKGRKTAIMLAGALAALSIGAAEPTAEWFGGQYGTSGTQFPVSAQDSAVVTKTQNGLTISKNNVGNTSTADYMMIKTDSGWPMTVSGLSTKTVSVVVAYSLPTGFAGDNPSTIVGLSCGTSQNHVRFTYNVTSAGALKLGYRGSGGGGSYLRTDLGKTQPRDGSIHYAVMTYAGSGNGTTLYYDGALLANDDGLKEGGATLTEIDLGAVRGPANRAKGIKFYYVAVYGSALSAVEASAAYTRAFEALNGAPVEVSREIASGATASWSDAAWTVGGTADSSFEPDAGTAYDVTVTVGGDCTIDVPSTTGMSAACNVKFVLAEGASSANVALNYNATLPANSGETLSLNPFGAATVSAGTGVTLAPVVAGVTQDYLCSFTGFAAVLAKRPDVGVVSVRIGARTQAASGGYIDPLYSNVGPYPMSGLFWNQTKFWNDNSTTGNYTDIQNLTDAKDGTSSVRIGYYGHNTYFNSSANDASTPNQVLTKTYLDDSDSGSGNLTATASSGGETINLPSPGHARGWQLHFENIPYNAYDVYFITASDVENGNLKECPIYVSLDGGANWTSYVGDSANEKTVMGTAPWTGLPYATGGNLVQGKNYIKMRITKSLYGDNIGTIDITHGTRNTGNSTRSGLAGIQIVEVLNDGVYTLEQSGDWSDAIWTAGSQSAQSWSDTVEGEPSIAKIASSSTVSSVAVDQNVSAGQVVLTGSDAFTLAAGGGTLTVSTGFDASSFTGALNLQAPIDGTVYIGSGTSLQFGGDTDMTLPAYTLDGAGAWTKVGTGVLTAQSSVALRGEIAEGTLDIASSYSGDLLLNGGSLEFNGGNGEIVYSGSASNMTGNASGKAVIASGVVQSTNVLDLDIDVENGATLKLGGQYGFGGYGSATSGKTITAKAGSVIELNGVQGCNEYTLAGGVLRNSGSEIGVGSRQTVGLTLAGNSEVNAAGAFGLVGNGHAATSIALGAYDLEKTGSADLYLVNTAISGTGTFRISEGTVYAYDEFTSPDATIEVASGATLKIRDLSTSSTKAFSFSCAALDGSGTVDVYTSRSGVSLAFAEGNDLTLKLELSSNEGAITIPCTGAPASVELYVPGGSQAIAAKTVSYENGNIVISPNGSSLSYANPVTGESVDFTYAFTGAASGDWANTANWTQQSGGWAYAFSGSIAPGISNSNCWSPTVFDGDAIAYEAGEEGYKDVTVSSVVEGWQARFALYNSARVTVSSIKKFQSDTSPGSWLFVDETSKLVINEKASGGNNGYPLNVYIAAPEGLEFATDFDFDAGSGNTVGYYLGPQGSVKYASTLTHGSHAIKTVKVDLGDSAAQGVHKGVVSRKLVSFTSSTKEFDLTAATVADAAATPVAMAATESAADGSDTTLGAYTLVQRTDGVYIDYVGYSADAVMAWTYDDNGDVVNSYTTDIAALMAFSKGEGESIRFASAISSAYHDALIAGCTYDATTVTYTRIPGVASITSGGNTYTYITLEAAFADANTQTADTITLLANIELSSTITVDRSVTLDLAGFNVTATDCRAFWVKAGSFAITGSGTVSTEVTQGTAFADSSSVVRVGDSVNTGTAASFTLGADATVASDYCYGVTYFGPNPMTVVLNGTVAVTGAQPAISGVGTSAGSATVTVAGTVSATQDYAIYNPQRGTTTVAGTAIVTGGIEVKGGNLVVQDGATITARDVAESHDASANGSSTAGYAIATVYAAGNYAGGVKPTASIGAANITGKVVALAEGSATEIAEVTATSNEIAVPEGYRWEETEEEGVYTLAQIVMHLEPASMELYPNCSNYVYVVDAPAGSTFYFKYAGAGVGSGGFSKTEGWGKPYAKAPGTNGTVTAYVTNNNVEVGVLVCNVTVKDVVAKIGSVEYAKAQWAEAVNAAIASGEVLEVYYNAGTVTLAAGQTLRWKAADNRNQGKVVAVAAAATETAMFKVTSTKDSSTGVTTAVCTNEGAPNVEITKANGDVSYSATLTLDKANATYKLLRSFTCGTVAAAAAGVTLDLNGQTLTTTGYVYVRKLTGGASLTITDTSAGGAGAIVGTGTEAYPLIWAANDKSQAEVVIEAGSFTAAGNGVAVYTSDGGVATINGGTFRTTKDSAAFLLNCQDAYKGTITVNGGVFYGFDPANNTADGAGTNFLGENKQSVETSAGVFTVSDIPAGLQVKVGDTVIEFAETANALTATLPSGATLDDVKVIAATGEDVTAGFAKTLEGETVTLALKPVEYAAETDDTAALWTDNGDGTVTLNVVLVPGLYYAAASSATLGGLAKPAEMTQAAAGTTLTAPKPAGATGFFQVWVAIEPPAGE